ncbi:MAG: hypothetical protein AAF410_00955 [Pseudomonadota bacterium]
MEQPLNHIIIGHGYLGPALAVRFHDQPCWLINRSGEFGDKSTQHQTLALDINQPSQWQLLDSLKEEDSLIVYFMVPPSKIDPDQFPSFVNKLDQFNIKRRILVSSTVVYGQQERIVDADSNIILDSERAKRQYQFEQDWMSNKDHAMIVRMAGLYGPGRIIGKRLIETGNNLSGNPNAWLNLIHIDDAAALLECIAYLDQVNNIELGSNGVPLKRIDYYEIVARLLHKNLPEFVDITDDIGRCCKIDLTMGRTGWAPKHTDIKASLKEIM